MSHNSLAKNSSKAEKMHPKPSQGDFAMFQALARHRLQRKGMGERNGEISTAIGKLWKGMKRDRATLDTYLTARNQLEERVLAKCKPKSKDPSSRPAKKQRTMDSFVKFSVDLNSRPGTAPAPAAVAQAVIVEKPSALQGVDIGIEKLDAVSVVTFLNTITRIQGEQFWGHRIVLANTPFKVILVQAEKGFQQIDGNLHFFRAQVICF